MQLIRTIANVTYPAIVVPRGKRLERRVSLRTPAEYAIASVTAGEIRQDAVVTFTRASKKAPPVRTGFAGWNGRLWLPMTDPADGRPVAAEAYLVHAGDLAWQERWQDPFWQAYDRRIWSASDASADEGSFAGKIIWSDKSNSLLRNRSACEKVLFVDGIVHLRTDGPAWRCLTGINDRTLLVLGNDDYRQPAWADPFSGRQKWYDTTFRADRKADAAAWGALAGRDIRVRGELLEFDPTYLVRNDLAHELNKSLALDFGSAAEIALRLPAGLVARWQRLVDAVDPRRPFFRDGVSDPACVAADLEALLRHLDVAPLPVSLIPKAKLLLGKFASALDFCDFAMSRDWPEAGVRRDSPMQSLA